VSSTALAPGGTNPTEEACEGKGGSKFTVGGKETFACNGAKGGKGKEGSPWTDNGTLPPQKTETGAWSFQGKSVHSNGLEGTLVSISFPIPLAAALTNAGCKPALKNCAAHYVNTNGSEMVHNAGVWEEVKVEQCTGSAAAPTAEPGNLCVYETQSDGFEETENASGIVKTPLVLPPNFTASTLFKGEVGAGTTGAIVRINSPIAINPEEEAALSAYGSWAVTAPEEA